MTLTEKSSPKIYFDGLNEIRAIAALMVLIHHIELYKFTGTKLDGS